MEEEYAFLKLLLTEPLFLAPPDVATPAFPFKGGYAKRVLVVLAHEPSLEEEHFLMKVLQSVKLDERDIALIYASDYAQLPEALTHFSPKMMLSFGLQWSEQYALNQRVQGIPTLGADPLPAIAQDMEKKKRLWEAMKAFFALA